MLHKESGSETASQDEVLQKKARTLLLWKSYINATHLHMRPETVFIYCFHFFSYFVVLRWKDTQITAQSYCVCDKSYTGTIYPYVTTMQLGSWKKLLLIHALICYITINNKSQLFNLISNE